ncbi:MAG: site-specific integrase, partial [Verrucomicrobia bacterium]|nr:site-specific integrase [Verrucomicrobiota bacterium]
MATVIKKSGSPYWYARYRVNGRDVTRSTGTASRRDAEALLRRWRAADKGGENVEDAFQALLSSVAQRAKSAGGDPQELEKAQTQRRRMAAELLQRNRERMSLADAWQAWVDAPKKRDPRQKTLDDYGVYWRTFTAWAAKAGIEWMHEVTPCLAEEYGTHLKANKAAPRTFRGHVFFLRAVFRTLRNRAGMMENPFDAIPLVELQIESRRELTAEEIAKVIGNASGGLRVMLLIGLFTGLRLGDVARLRWTAIDFTKGMISVVPGKTARKGKRVTIPLHAGLAKALCEWRAKVSDGSDHVFPDEANIYERDPAAVSKRIQRIFEASGIQTNEKMKGRKRAVVRVGFHSLRHSFVSLCAAAGVPQHVVQTLVGHGSPAMTEHYTHVDAEQKRKAIA